MLEKLDNTPRIAAGLFLVITPRALSFFSRETVYLMIWKVIKGLLRITWCRCLMSAMLILKGGRDMLFSIFDVFNCEERMTTSKYACNVCTWMYLLAPLYWSLDEVVIRFHFFFCIASVFILLNFVHPWVECGNTYVVALVGMLDS
jgi:hypothetical protein